MSRIRVGWGVFAAMAVLSLLVTACGTTGADASARLGPRTNDSGQVVIEVTPLNVDESDGPLQFEVRMNTHSVDLGYDLAQLARLHTSRGDEVAPTEWTGALGGHHVEGILSFPGDVLQDATWFDVVLHDVAGAPEQTFSWELQ